MIEPGNVPMVRKRADGPVGLGRSGWMAIVACSVLMSGVFVVLRPSGMRRESALSGQPILPSDSTGIATGREPDTTPIARDSPHDVGRSLQIYPNEPSGFKKISERGFSEREEDGWKSRPGRNLVIMEDPTAPASPPYIARAIFPSGFRAGSGPNMENREIEGNHTSLYISAWLRLSSNWEGHRSGTSKIIHFWIGGRNRVILKAHGAGQRPLVARIALQAVNQTPVSRDLEPNRGRSVMSRGQWHNIEVLLYSNTPGMPDGRIQWWLDGQLAGDYSGLNLVPMRAENFWNKVSWNPTWGGVGGFLQDEQTMDMDDMYISAK